MNEIIKIKKKDISSLGSFDFDSIEEGLLNRKILITSRYGFNLSPTRDNSRFQTIRVHIPVSIFKNTLNELKIKTETDFIFRLQISISIPSLLYFRNELTSTYERYLNLYEIEKTKENRRKLNIAFNMMVVVRAITLINHFYSIGNTNYLYIKRKEPKDFKGRYISFGNIYRFENKRQQSDILKTVKKLTKIKNFIENEQ